MPFWTPKPLKRTPQDTQYLLCRISKNLNPKLINEFFHFLIIPMTLFNDIMPYFDEFICMFMIEIGVYCDPPEKFGRPNILQSSANFRHPVSKSWLRHWWSEYLADLLGKLTSRLLLAH